MVSRAEQRQTTLLRLGDAAIELFEECGPRATIDAIAERAGVSRRTVFRWFDAKEELAFVHPLLWFDVFQAALDSQPSDRAPADRLRQASLAIARHVDSDPAPPRRAFVVAASYPELARGFYSIFQRWIDRVAAEAQLAGVDPFEARVIGSAVMGMVDAASRELLAAPAGTSFEEILASGIEYVDELLHRLDRASET